MEAFLKNLQDVEKEKDRLIKTAKEICESAPRERLPEIHELGILRAVAASTSSVEEIKLHIQYQMAKDRKWKDSGFGKALLQKIEKFEQSFREKEKLLMITQLFIGYLVRYAFFLHKSVRTSPRPARGAERKFRQQKRR